MNTGLIFSLSSSMSVLNSLYTFFWSSKNFSFQICELCFFNFLFLLADSFFNFALFFSMVFVKDLTLIGPHSSYIFFRLRLLFLVSHLSYQSLSLSAQHCEIRRLSCRISSSNSISHFGCFHLPLRLSMRVISVLKGFIPLTIIHPMTAEYTIQFKIHNADQGFEWLIMRLSSITYFIDFFNFFLCG